MRKNFLVEIVQINGLFETEQMLRPIIAMQETGDGLLVSRLPLVILINVDGSTELLYDKPRP